MLPGAEGSVDKLLMTRADQCIGHAVMDLRGAEAVLAEELSWDVYVWSRAASIYGGTRQIQRNIVAQRVLGLPRH
jgi:alkylation response protein AidB-like acyl-CoA dehydrogenase